MHWPWLTGSVPRKIGRGAERVSALSRNWIHVVWLSVTCPILTTKPCISCWKKTVYDLSYFATCNLFLCVQYCRTRIFQVEFQGQIRNKRILERKPLIHTSYRIRHRAELKYFHSHNFCSMLIEQLIDLTTSKKWELITWNLGQIFEIEFWMVGQ